MGVGFGLYMYEFVVKRWRSLSHLLMSSCLLLTVQYNTYSQGFYSAHVLTIREEIDM